MESEMSGIGIPWDDEEGIEAYLEENFDEETFPLLVLELVMEALGITNMTTEVYKVQNIIGCALKVGGADRRAMRPAPIREAPANYISGRSWNESSDFPMGEWFHAGNLLVDAAMLIISDLAVTDRVPTPTELQEFSDWEFAAEIPWSLGISGVVVNTAAADGVYPVELLVEQGEFGTFTKGVRVMFFDDEDGD
jgi:hypothetical protein